ncbi:hypothetical protein DFH08DRAFT_1033494 [Mycena albidolilacea]|uniref:Uncharacterized protein n=1 Tax=Mycena albidolilacea TaxID=1033008 RepID=A0AAD6ZGA4_9AGAR|nr:hypothetical protein DFH08DRAFT_1033494 [Mycena albidolilacea]
MPPHFHTLPPRFPTLPAPLSSAACPPNCQVGFVAAKFDQKPVWPRDSETVSIVEESQNYFTITVPGQNKSDKWSQNTKVGEGGAKEGKGYQQQCLPVPFISGYKGNVHEKESTPREEGSKNRKTPMHLDRVELRLIHSIRSANTSGQPAAEARTCIQVTAGHIVSIRPEASINREFAQQPYEPSDGFCAVRIVWLMAHMARDILP